MAGTSRNWSSSKSAMNGVTPLISIGGVSSLHYIKMTENSPLFEFLLNN